MAKVIINGTLVPIRQPREVDFDPVRGVIVIEEYKSAGNNCQGLAGALIQSGVQFKLKMSGVVSTITATYSGGQGTIPDNPQEHWEVLGNEIQKSIFESGIAMSGVSLFPNLLNDVRDGWSSIQKGDSVAEQELRDSLSGGELVYYDQLIGFLLRGQSNWWAGQYVAKLTTSVSAFYSGDAFIGSAERLWSTESLLNLGMPALASQIISSVFPGASHDNYAWSWRQLPPRAVTGAQNRMEVSVEWWFEEWSTLLYGNPI